MPPQRLSPKESVTMPVPDWRRRSLSTRESAWWFSVSAFARPDDVEARIARVSPTCAIVSESEPAP